MKIGIISDVHNNMMGLTRALEALSDVDEIFCAGDVVYEYSFNNEVFEVIRSRRIRTVLGNHESRILSRDGIRLRTSGKIKPDNLEYMQNLPITLVTRVNGKRILMAHGSPWEPLRDYVFPETGSFKKLGSVNADVVILGHTHCPMVERINGTLVINPGSCGEARDHRYNLQLTYAILDLDTGEAVIKTMESLDESRSGLIPLEPETVDTESEGTSE